MVAEADAYRLLKQATFGPTEAAMSEVKQMGVTAWVDSQLNMPVLSKMPALEFYPAQAPTTCTNDRVANSAATLCARDNYTFFQLQLKFTQNALKQADQLRQRVAFALSQILVTSGADSTIMPYGMAKYQQMLLDGAFGNYKDLLTAVTLSPVMGDYLNMANSNKPDVARGIAANENFAREIMQLFSIGLYELNQDGTTKKDTQGALIPTYSQTTVENLARVFTGWTYPGFGNVAPVRNNAGGVKPRHRCKNIDERLCDSCRAECSSGLEYGARPSVFTRKRRPVHFQTTHSEAGQWQPKSRLCRACERRLQQQWIGRSWRP
jgi:uncharacterized protein (DUF1800 family)